MKYMFLIYSAEECWTQEEWTQCTEDSRDICHELAAKNQFIAASPLHPVAMATSVRVREGKRQITDGPFAETSEQLGGYYIIDVENLDDAISIASRLPPAKKGTVEIRPVYEMQDLPKSG
ncbi:YciI family protein [Novipirellula sp. SH528]|uniref:YciI family protein n=1 Tax=Novipirellula sp. SH528 TaxID=3454466 RepID=UPI003F9F0CA0